MSSDSQEEELSNHLNSIRVGLVCVLQWLLAQKQWEVSQLAARSGLPVAKLAPIMQTGSAEIDVMLLLEQSFELSRGTILYVVDRLVGDPLFAPYIKLYFETGNIPEMQFGKRSLQLMLFARISQLFADEKRKY